MVTMRGYFSYSSFKYIIREETVYTLTCNADAIKWQKHMHKLGFYMYYIFVSCKYDGLKLDHYFYYQFYCNADQ